MFANFVYFCTTRGKKTTFHEKVVETLARNTNVCKICKLRGTRFSDQITNQNLVYSWNNLLSRYTVII